MFTNTSRPSAVDVLRPLVIGDLFQADSTSTLARLPDVAVGNVLLSGGVGALATWGKVTLTSHVSGILPAINGGTGVANAGTITNASNLTVTGGGQITLGGFTLTVPATGTAALLATANTFTLVNTFSNNTDATAVGTGAVVLSAGGLSVNNQIRSGGAIQALGKLQSGDSSNVGQFVVDAPSANAPSYDFRAAGTVRWQIIQAGTSQNLSIGAYNSSGVLIDTPLTITNATTAGVSFGRSAIITSTTGLPAATTGNLSIAGGIGSPILGRLYVGDGTGWRLEMAKRTGSTDTALFKFNDTGVMSIDTTSGTTLSVLSATDSTTKDTGSIVTEGGIGVEKAIVTGTSITAGTTVTANSTTDSTSITTGSIITAGGVGVAKRLTLDGGTGKTIKYVNGTANAAVAVTFGAVGPTGSTAGNQLGWIRVDIGGTDRYIPYW